MTREEYAEFVALTCTRALRGKSKKGRHMNIKLLGALTLATIFEREAWAEKDLDYIVEKKGVKPKPEVGIAHGAPAITINEDAHGDQAHCDEATIPLEAIEPEPVPMSAGDVTDCRHKSSY
jgi:hypothetical protein